MARVSTARRGIIANNYRITKVDADADIANIHMGAERTADGWRLSGSLMRAATPILYVV